ncbi:MAG: 4-(cytidine 5'-diphospho)-2-C-methyl-D-erythritol kinase [Actinomycetota bacterium]
MDPITGRAYAKLNVFLRVLGRRDDGFHEIQTLVMPVSLHDVVTVSPADVTSVKVGGPRSGDLDRAGGESLCARAVTVFERVAGVMAPVAIRIDKRIPVGAGMGGGSADAAAVLRALATMHGLDPAGLLDASASIGSDVPALLHGGPVIAEGRGERLIPVHAVTTHWVVVPQPFGVSTPDAYAWWDEDPRTGPDPGALIAAVETGNIDVLASALSDDLEAGVARRHPEVDIARAALLEAGAAGVVMTGSGPTVVGLAAHLGIADRVALALPDALVTSGPPATMDRPSGVV